MVQGYRFCKAKKWWSAESAFWIQNKSFSVKLYEIRKKTSYLFINQNRIVTNQVPMDWIFSIDKKVSRIWPVVSNVELGRGAQGGTQVKAVSLKSQLDSVELNKGFSNRDITISWSET